jgi:hypothetical protein
MSRCIESAPLMAAWGVSDLLKAVFNVRRRLGGRELRRLNWPVVD